MSCVGRRLQAGCVSLLIGVALFTAAGCRATSGWVYNSSGQGYYARGNYALARDEFRRASIDAPWNPDYRHNLAMAMKQTGDTAGAEQVLRQNLTQVSAMHQPTYHSLAQLLVEQSRHGEAQELIASWTDAQPYTPESHIEMAWIQRESGNLPAAEQSLRQALKVNPRHPKALAHFGQLYQDAGQPQLASTMYQRSLASRWNQPDVQSRMITLADGSSRATTRSAMMMNSSPSMISAGPMPTMAMSPTMTVSSGPVMTAGVSGWMPTPDPAASAMSTPTVIPMASPSPTIVTAPTTFEAPVMTVGPALTPNADPAHVETQMAAELPLVTPH